MSTGRDLTRTESVTYLGGASACRVALSVQALPYVFMAPIHLVTDASDGLSLVLAVDPADADLRAMQGNVVAVHTDGIAPDGGRWQVLVRGTSTVPDGGAPGTGPELARVRAELIRGWTSLGTPTNSGASTLLPLDRAVDRR